MRTTFLLAVLAFAAMASALLFGLAGFGTGDPQSAEAALLTEVKKLLASDAQAGADFGLRLAVSGDVAIIGAPGQNFGGLTDTGAAYIFQRDVGGADNWGEVAKLTASDAETDDLFGSSVAISGDTVIVGAPYEDSGGMDAGAAYVFQRDQGGSDNWGEVKKVTAWDAQPGDFLGKDVAIDGDIAIASSWRPSGGKGAAYAFYRDQGGSDNWGHVRQFTASDVKESDSFGISVAVAGDTAFVGAHLDDEHAQDAGAVYVFQRNFGGPDQWGEVKKILPTGGIGPSVFGFSLAADGDTLVVGAEGDFAIGPFAGSVYVYHRYKGGVGNWGDVAKITASDADSGDRFGSAVAIDGNAMAIAARTDEAGGVNSGTAYVLVRDFDTDDTWSELKKFIASDAQPFDLFGGSVGVSNDIVIVGAWGEDSGASNGGAAYAFEGPILPPAKQLDPSDTDGDGCSDQRENGSDETLGGQRDYLNPYDVYDVAGLSGPVPDGVVDLLFDVLGVIAHFAPFGGSPYDVNYDRGPVVGPNAWNMTAPDGVIDLLNDILGVIAQHGHDCR